MFGLVGESGCGKSTLGKMLANVITPTKGEIIYSGNPITQKNREFKRKIQMVTKNLTYLFISHDLNVVHYMSDRIGVMYLGKLMEVGRVNDLFYTPAHPYTKALLSSMPSVNMEERRERILLNGDIPNPPTGCPFQTRCRDAGADCQESCPDLQEIGEGHLVRCHYAQKDKYKENER